MGEWISIPDTNPDSSPYSNLDVRAGTLWLNAGAFRMFVIGQATGAEDALRSLLPSTIYYVRIMCGGDTRDGAFRTLAAPSEATRNLSIDLPAADSKVADALVSYGDAVSGAPNVLKTELGAVRLAKGVVPIRLSNINWNPQYIRVVYRDSGGVPTGAVSLFVLP